MYDIHAGKTHIHILKNLFLKLKRKRSPRRQQKGQAQRWERSQNLGGRMTKGTGYPWGPLHPRSHSLQPVPTSEKPQKCKKTDTTMGGAALKSIPSVLPLVLLREGPRVFFKPPAPQKSWLWVWAAGQVCHASRVCPGRLPCLSLLGYEMEEVSLHLIWCKSDSSANHAWLRNEAISPSSEGRQMSARIPSEGGRCPQIHRGGICVLTLVHWSPPCYRMSQAHSAHMWTEIADWGLPVTTSGVVVVWDSAQPSSQFLTGGWEGEATGEWDSLASVLGCEEGSHLPRDEKEFILK